MEDIFQIPVETCKISWHFKLQKANDINHNNRFALWSITYNFRYTVERRQSHPGNSCRNNHRVGLCQIWFCTSCACTLGNKLLFIFILVFYLKSEPEYNSERLVKSILQHFGDDPSWHWNNCNNNQDSRVYRIKKSISKPDNVKSTEYFSKRVCNASIRKGQYESQIRLVINIKHHSSDQYHCRSCISFFCSVQVYLVAVFIIMRFHHTRWCPKKCISSIKLP